MHLLDQLWDINQRLGGPARLTIDVIPQFRQTRPHRAVEQNPVFGFCQKL